MEGMKYQIFLMKKSNTVEFSEFIQTHIHISLNTPSEAAGNL
jgi:hypothetical protein